MARDEIQERPDEVRGKLVDKIVALGPAAVDSLRMMLDDPSVPPQIRASLIGEVLVRILGKPESTVNIRNETDNMEAAEDYISKLVEMIQEYQR